MTWENAHQSHLERGSGQNGSGHCKGSKSGYQTPEQKSPTPLYSCSHLTPHLQGSHTLHSPVWSTAIWTPRSGLMGFSLMLYWTQSQKWKLWTLVAFRSTQPPMHIFLDWFKDNRNLPTEKYNFTQIKIIHSLVQILENSFSKDIARTPLPLMMEKFHPPNPPATVLQLTHCTPESSL